MGIRTFIGYIHKWPIQFYKIEFEFSFRYFTVHSHFTASMSIFMNFNCIDVNMYYLISIFLFCALKCLQLKCIYFGDELCFSCISYEIWMCQTKTRTKRQIYKIRKFEKSNCFFFVFLPHINCGNQTVYSHQSSLWLMCTKCVDLIVFNHN